MCVLLYLDTMQAVEANDVAGQANFQFPTTCPSCDHSPLEADSCTINKSLRYTMRVWLQKHKKKEEAKAAAQAATPPVEVTPTAPEVLPVGDGAEKAVDSVEEAPKTDDAPAEQAEGATENAGDAGQRAGSASVQPNEVGLRCHSLLLRMGMLELYKRSELLAKRHVSQRNIKENPRLTCQSLLDAFQSTHSCY